VTVKADLAAAISVRVDSACSCSCEYSRRCAPDPASRPAACEKRVTAQTHLFNKRSLSSQWPTVPLYQSGVACLSGSTVPHLLSLLTQHGPHAAVRQLEAEGMDVRGASATAHFVCRRETHREAAPTRDGHDSAAHSREPPRGPVGRREPLGRPIASIRSERVHGQRRRGQPRQQRASARPPRQLAWLYTHPAVAKFRGKSHRKHTSPGRELLFISEHWGMDLLLLCPIHRDF
jgi:hypothetical protein